MSAYYNEIDQYAAQWLRNLIAAGHIAPGDVDERSIVDVRPDDLRGYRQCHFFGGVGAWSYALRQAGWSDDREVWTGSCPCQPFSVAGAGAGFADERHLWPTWFELIRELRPVVVFGEQVASKDALHWLDHVYADLENEVYAVGAVDSCAAGFGAPHIRQRLYFVAHADGRNAGAEREQCGREQRLLAQGGGLGIVADACGTRAWRDSRAATDEVRSIAGEGNRHRQPEADWLVAGGAVGGMADARCLPERRSTRPGETESRRPRGEPAGCYAIDGWPEPTNGFWRDADWIDCRDGKSRPVEPLTFPLASIPARGVGREQRALLRMARRNRVGRLRGYGNAINAETATEFITAYMDIA